jgi:peroxiredoxin Q/BCP
MFGGAAAAKTLEVGAQAPGFRAEAHDGSTVDLADLRGKKVVLWFYPKADTPGWTVQGNGFRSNFEKFSDAGVVILGASFDDRTANAAFAEKFGYPFLLLCDTSRTLGMAYGACDDASAKHARRITYVIDESGVIRHVLPKVDPATHTDVVWGLVP